MGEQRARVEQLPAVDLLPLIGRAIGAIALGRQRMRRRAEPEDVEQQSLVVSLPAMRNESVLRSPAMGQRRPAIAGPVPVGPTVERVGQAPDLGFDGRVAVEICGNCQGTCEQERRVDGGKLALPHAASGLDVQEVIEEALVAGGIGLGTLRAFEQVAQSLQRDLRGEIPEEDSALDDDRNGRQCHADGGDADRSGRVRLVAHQPIVRVGFVQVVQHRGQLQQAEILVGEQRDRYRLHQQEYRPWVNDPGRAVP